MTIKNGCNFSNADTEGSLYTYDPSKEAIRIIERIMEANVLAQNFNIKAADCKNALATTEGNERYILYNTAFLEYFKEEANTQWAAYCVLAHEIGHHLNNHDLSETDPAKRKLYELESDKFAGGVLRKLGANLEQAQAGINTFSLEGESKTHPSKNARLTAIAVGWKQMDETLSTEVDVNAVLAKNSKEMNLLKQAKDEKDPEKAYALLSEVLNTKASAEAYFLRGKLLLSVKEEESALSDFTDAINFKKNYAEAYLARAETFINMENTEDACRDLDKAIQFKSDFTEAYVLRGQHCCYEAYEKCKHDFDKAISLNPRYADAYLYKGKMHDEMEEYEKSIENYSKALDHIPQTTEFNDKVRIVLSSRVKAKIKLGQFKEAIADYNKLETIEDSEYYRIRRYLLPKAKCKQALGQHKEAIIDLDKYIAKEGQTHYIDQWNPMLMRGVSKWILGLKKEAENDFYQTDISDYRNLYGLGRLFVEYRQYKEGIKWLDEALKNERNTYKYEATIYRGVSKWILGLKKEAEDDFNKYIDPQKRQEDYKVIRKIGCLFVEHGQYKEGIKWLDEALKYKPDLEEAKNCKSEALKKM